LTGCKQKWLASSVNSNTKSEISVLPKTSFKLLIFTKNWLNKISTVDSSKAIAIDLGVDNLCACIDSIGHQFLIDGKRLKSINQWYNKRNAQLQSAKDKQGIKSFTTKQARLYQWRNNCVRDYLNKAARLIIDHCLNHQIGKLIVGYNPGIKQEINILFQQT
jgi:putative transposase